MSKPINDTCPCNVIRKSKERYAENVYICGSCAKLWIATERKEYEPLRARDRTFKDGRPEWGLRNRQA